MQRRSLAASRKEYWTPERNVGTRFVSNIVSNSLNVLRAFFYENMLSA